MLYSLPEYVHKLRVDLRHSSIHNQTLQRTHLLQKKKIEELLQKNKELQQELKKVKKEKEKLKQEIEKITKTQNRYKVALFDHGNFKNPQGQEKKKKGGQKGHADTNQDIQRNYAAYQKQRIFTHACGKCGKTLARVTGTKDKTLIDIQINTELIQMIISSERQWCKTCKTEVRATYPSSLPFTEYGLNTFMVVLHLRFKGKQSFSTIAHTLNGLFGLSISKAGVGTLLAQAKTYLQGKYEQLKKTIREGSVMYNDETGWSVRGKSAWMWIMASQTETLYVAAESRGKGIMQEMYGNAKSYSMHDGYAGYTNTVPYEKQLYCWAHLLRFVHEETVLAVKDSPEWLIKEKLVFLYQQIRSHPEYSKEQKEKFLSAETKSLLSIKPKNKTMENILHRLKTQRDGLIRALLVTEDGTNNLAERELRPLAISRNISYGSDTYSGMETTAILASIIQTISRDKTKPMLPTLKAYLQEGIQEKYPHYKHSPLFSP